MANTYSTTSVAGAPLLVIDADGVSGSPLWGCAAFWESMVFEVISRERERGGDSAAGLTWSQMDAGERVAHEEREDNTAFGQVLGC